MSSKRIMVTGCAGHIGANLTHALLKEGHHVIGIDDMSGGAYSFLPKEPNPMFSFYQVDLGDYAKTEEIFMLSRPHALYHLAANAREGASFYSPHAITRANSYISSVVFELAVRYKTERIIYTSSMARFGDQEVPFVETMPTKSVDLYGSNKICTEECLRMLGEVHGFQWVILVPRNIFGPMQAMWDRYRNFIAIAMQCIMRGEPITIYGKGHVRSFSFVGDAIPCFLKVLDPGPWDKEVISVGGLQPMTIDDVTREIIKNFPEYTKPEVVHLPERHGEVKIAYCDPTKSISMLGYEEKFGFKKGVAIMSEWAKTQGVMEWRKDKLALPNETIPDPWKALNS